MSKITQYSRISHHTITGSMSATFSVPAGEDFTDGTWTVADLALSEIGVNEDAEKAYIRTGASIKEINFVGATAGTETLAQTLASGNTSGPNHIIMDDGFGLFNNVLNSFIRLNDTPGSEINQKVIDGTGAITDLFQKSDGWNVTSSTGSNTNYILVENSPFFEGVELSTTDGTNTSELTLSNTNPPVIELITTDGIKQSTIQCQPNQIISSIVDGGVNSTLSLTPNSITINCDDNNALLIKTEITIVPTEHLLLVSDQNTSELALITTNSTKHEISVSDGTDTSILKVIPKSVNIQQVNNFRAIATTNNTATITIFTFPFTPSGPFNVSCKIKCINSALTQAYVANLFAGFIFDGTTVTQLSTTDKVEKSTLVGATSDISFTGADLIVTVTGLAATTIDWVANIEIQ